MKKATLLYYFRTNNSQNNNLFKCVNLEKDYYRVLDVQCDACGDMIKRAYLKLVKKLHPDFNPSGHDRFTEVQEAYNILSDKKLKGYYDANNKFYQQQTDTNKQQEDARNQQFYNDMKNKCYENYEEQTKNEKQQQEEEPQENQEQARQRRRFEEEIKLTRRILFTKNPIWQRANAYMNYEERQRRVEEKEKQFETLFPKGAKFANSFKKWIF